MQQLIPGIFISACLDLDYVRSHTTIRLLADYREKQQPPGPVPATLRGCAKKLSGDEDENCGPLICGHQLPANDSGSGHFTSRVNSPSVSEHDAEIWEVVS